VPIHTRNKKKLVDRIMSASLSDKQRLASKLTEKVNDKSKAKTTEGKQVENDGSNVLNSVTGNDDFRTAEPCQAKENAKSSTNVLGRNAKNGDTVTGAGEDDAVDGEDAGACAGLEVEEGAEATLVAGASIDGEQAVGEEITDGADGDSAVPVAASVDAKDAYRIETGDTIKVKQVLDASILMCVAEQCGYKIDFSAENWKLFLMFVACCFALTAQFYPLPFPASRPILGICCGGYFAISGLLQYILSFVDGDCILTSYAGNAATVHDEEKKAAGGPGAAAAAKPSPRPAIEVHTSFPRFQEWFTLIIQKRGEKDKLKRCVAQMYVGKYFTEAGDYDEDRFTEDVRLHVKRFQEGKTGLEWTYDHKTKND
jgi:signal peptidase complex subunit 2